MRLLSLTCGVNVSALLAALCVCSAALAQQNVSAPASTPVASTLNLPVPRILFAGRPLPMAAGTPFRDPVDGAVCVAPQSLAPLGAVYVIDEQMGKATFALPAQEGSTTVGATVTVGLRTAPAGSVAKGWFVPVLEVVEGLGGKCEYNTATNTLYAHSVLTGVEFANGTLTVRATLPVRPKLTRDNGGRKIIIDFPGAEVGILPRVLPVSFPALSQVRSGQFQPDTARIVLDLKTRAAGFAFADNSFSSVVALNGTGVIAQTTQTANAAPGPVIVARQEQTPVQANPAPAVQTDPNIPATVSTINGVSVRRISDRQMQLVISATGRSETEPTAALDQQTLILSFANAGVSENATASLARILHPFIKAARLLAPATATAPAQLIVDLSRTVTFTVRPGIDGSTIVDIGLPRGAGGHLAGKLIAVDAGHGNHDAGARGVNGTYEKNVNLAIATKVADTLRDSGANVLMTRTRDTFIPVNQRPAIAGRAGADFFLSIHSDSTDSGPKLRGSTVYFHGNNPHCRALAKSISNRFEQMGGIPSRGVRTDFVRFPGEGYGVLRNARMTAVLIECGFMTNPSDVKQLNDKAMQQRIAEAITDGLRDYIEGNPDADSRNNNPKVKVQGPIQIQAPAPTVPTLPATEPVTPAVEPTFDPASNPQVIP